MSDIFGFDAYAYRHASTLLDDDTNAIEVLIDTMTEMANIRDLSISNDAEEVDNGIRANAPWKTTAPGLLDMSVEFQMKVIPGDDDYQFIRTKYFTRTAFAAVFLNQTKDDVTAEGPSANWHVYSFNPSQELGNVQWVDVTIKPTSYPEWAVVGEFPSGE